MNGVGLPWVSGAGLPLVSGAGLPRVSGCWKLYSSASLASKTQVLLDDHFGFNFFFFN